VEFIADITETKWFWTEIMRDENLDLKGAFDGKIEFGFIDPSGVEG
jgi:phage terminase small subunit